MRKDLVVFHDLRWWEVVDGLCEFSRNALCPASSECPGSFRLSQLCAVGY